MLGCDSFCEYAEARVSQSVDGRQRLPLITYMNAGMPMAVRPYSAADSVGVSQFIVDEQCWVTSTASEGSEDWYLSSLLDVAGR